MSTAKDKLKESVEAYVKLIKKMKEESRKA